MQLIKLQPLTSVVESEGGDICEVYSSLLACQFPRSFLRTLFVDRLSQHVLVYDCRRLI